MLAGVAVSRSGGSFDYDGGGGSESLVGEYDLRLTGVHPYAGWSLSPDLEIWGTVGFAKGKLRVRIGDDLRVKSMASAATLTTGTVGVNSRLLERETATLRLKGEWSLARLDVAGAGAVFRSAEANLRRLRVVTEASHKSVIPNVGLLTPWAEVGLRHDGGDGETGLSPGDRRRPALPQYRAGVERGTLRPPACGAGGCAAGRDGLRRALPLRPGHARLRPVGGPDAALGRERERRAARVGGGRDEPGPRTTRWRGAWMRRSATAWRRLAAGACSRPLEA